MSAKLLLTAVSITALLGACTTTDPYSSTPRRNNAGTGVIAGALGGALLGYLTNTSNSEEGRKNALIGAGIGALGGGAVGAYMDRQQRELEAELSGTGVGVARQGDNLILRMPADVTFASNQSGVNARSFATLDDVAQVLNRYDQSIIDIFFSGRTPFRDLRIETVDARYAEVVRLGGTRASGPSGIHRRRETRGYRGGFSRPDRHSRHRRRKGPPADARGGLRRAGVDAGDRTSPLRRLRAVGLRPARSRNSGSPARACRPDDRCCADRS
jgi:hypothetical protein